MRCRMLIDRLVFWTTSVMVYAITLYYRPQTLRVCFQFSFYVAHLAKIRYRSNSVTQCFINYYSYPNVLLIAVNYGPPYVTTISIRE